MTETAIPSAAASSTSAWRRVPIRDFAYFSLAVMLTMDALEGYAIAGLPFPWIGMALAIPLLIVIAAHERLKAPPGTALYLLLMLWLIGNTAIASMTGSYAEMHPSTATTPYPVFVLLRGYTFIGYLFLLIIIYNYALTDERERLVDFVVWLGLVVVAYAFYVYVAQRTGLPIPPKTRYGTAAGGAQSGGELGTYGDGEASFLFRVTGSFREPSFMAVWLLTPFLLSLTRGRPVINWRSMVLAIGLLATGSLTTALTLPISFVLAMVLLNPLRRQSLAILLGVSFGIGVLVASLETIFQMTFQSGDGFGFVGQFSHRIEKLLDGGIVASNRGYAYEKLLDSEFSLVGLGLGNAHIYYSRGAPTPVSFLSLYIHVWFAAGAVAVALLVLYLLSPLALTMLRHRVRRPETIWLVAGHISWLIVYFVNAESFSMMPALASGLLLAHLMKQPPPAPGRPVD